MTTALAKATSAAAVDGIVVFHAHATKKVLQTNKLVLRKRELFNASTKGFKSQPERRARTQNK